ncbi:Os05g0272300 [Oryza sativa Japonica Group]|uniref:Os05g0272300 protein n=1 Tax=Oryza sativa subsp. japonica TaxID=39947 RepID=A0A0N7KKF8_ORYSJ|nr:hypothetical protein EE612_028283 [Oryza sativa]BAS93097.1 Os05g0272300 [Oryza sativa Japonica Group]
MASGGDQTTKSRILVVGGTGYIGRHVVAARARLVQSPQVPDQTSLITAIKEIGGGRVRRFIPSEFGLDPGRGASAAVEPVRSRPSTAARWASGAP